MREVPNTPSLSHEAVVREWRYRVVLKGRVFATSAEEAEELAMDAAMEGDAEDDEVEVERA